MYPTVARSSSGQMPKPMKLKARRFWGFPLASDGALSQANKVLYSFAESGAVIQEIYGQLISDDTVNVRVWNDGDLKANTNKDQLWLARLSGTLQVCDDDVQPGVSSVQGSEAGGRCGPASGSSPARWG